MNVFINALLIIIMSNHFDNMFTLIKRLFLVYIETLAWAKSTSGRDRDAFTNSY